MKRSKLTANVPLLLSTNDVSHFLEVWRVAYSCLIPS